MRKLILLTLLVGGCTFDALSFECSADADCKGGRCIAGACALPAADCASGYRWDSSAGANAGACYVASSPAPDLAMPAVDDLAQPSRMATGASCSSSAACESGHCVDGLCCETACDSLCYSCALPGAEGHCKPAPSGTNPRNECTADGTPCGLDGTCDGAGACRHQVAGTICAPQACASGTLTRAAVCNGHGDCSTPTTRPCAPYVCLADGTDCTSSCGAAGGCAPPNNCSSGSCGLAPAGATCSGAGDCLSGHCADGVCCNEDCLGACRSCKLTGTEGTCTTAAAGAVDPHHVCSDQGASSCGQTGKCTAAGTCEFYAAGTVCAEAHCSSDLRALIDTSTCPGNGASCTTSGVFGCDPYTCAPKSAAYAAHCENNCGCCLCLPGMQPPFLANCAVGRSCINRCSDQSQWSCQ